MLTGDVHANYAAELKADFDDPLSETIGTEFVATSISSGGDGVDVPANVTVLRGENPHIKFVNTQRGYLVCDLTRPTLALGIQDGAVRVDAGRAGFHAGGLHRTKRRAWLDRRVASEP